MVDSTYWPPGSPTELAERARWYVSRGIFLSPSEAPPKCEPNGGDRTMLSYDCPNCTEVSWAVPVDPRAFGIDRDFQPEDGWCVFCGAEGVTKAAESPAELLRRVAPELGT